MQIKLVPTEIDTLFRHETHQRLGTRRKLQHFWVEYREMQDYFASATDLAKMMQMYMNYGSYNGKRYLSEATVREFAKSAISEKWQ